MTEQNEGKSEGNFNDKSLFFFYPASDQLASVFKNYKVLKTLIIIGQSIESLEGINELRLLEELWIVECNLEQEAVEPISRCFGLKRLYLYNNALTAIPNMESLTKLSHLWLSDNRLESFKGINKLLNVKELCLSNNNIATVDTKLSTTLKIVFLNLSGNPIKSVKEIQKLQDLRRMRWLVLSDPLFRTSPISLLANLRHMVIHTLPGLEKLNMLHISQAERTQTAKFFDAKLEYYRLSLHNSLAKLYSLQKTITDLEFKELEKIWIALRNHCTSLEKDDGSKSNNLKFWEDEAQRWKKRFSLLCHKFEKLSQITVEAVNCEVESCGNLKFLEVDLTDHEVQNQLKTEICSFMCSHLRKDVLDVKLQNAWCIQGHCRMTALQSQFEDSLDNIYIITPVQDLGIQPLKVIEDILFGNVSDREFLVTTCLSQADPLVLDNTKLHRQLLLQSQSLLSPRLMVVCGISDPSQLTVKMQSSHGCHQWSLSDSSSLVPLYLLHYQYMFQDYFKTLRTAPVVEERLQVAMPLPLDTKHSQNITELQLAGSNLHKLDFSVMENVRTLDISRNQFENISSVGLVFPHLTVLNVAFNKIHTLFNLQGLTDVTHLTLSWNFLTDFLSTLNSLKSLKALKHVDLSSNPFRDVICDLHQQFFVCKHLKSLTAFNDTPLSRSVLKEEVTLKGQDQFPINPASRKHKLPFSIRWKSELSSTQSENHLGVISNQVTSITMKGLKLAQFKSVFSLSKVKWIDFSGNLFYGSSTLKGLPNLEEVNLSHNVIEAFSCLSEGFKLLTKLNLSHNYISSLANFTCEALPQLKLLDLSNNKLKSVAGLSSLKTLRELYLSHNSLQDSIALTYCKDMKELRVLDVSYNPLVQTDSFKSTCLYYINSLKFINGCKVLLSEAKSAVTLFEGLLDQDYLLRIHKSATIINLTQLSLSNCSIKKVLLQDLTLPNVTSVTLDHNQIASLSWVQSFPKLKRLNLSYNRVSSYGEDCSPGLRLSPPCLISSLTSLILDHNHIKHLPPLKLDLFPNLNRLMLNDNEISSLLGLKNNSRLEHLVLDKNKLSSISCDQTEQLQSLLELYVERNSLSKLDFLRPLKNLRKLFLGHNKLVTRNSLDPLAELPMLEELTIHGNPIFRSSKSYRDCLPSLPSLQLLEGHPVNKSN